MARRMFAAPTIRYPMRCWAVNSRTVVQCPRLAMRGTLWCRFHSGTVPQSSASAEVKAE
jgi:hypothetical protein